jgi:hypothetical protein
LLGAFRERALVIGEGTTGEREVGGHSGFKSGRLHSDDGDGVDAEAIPAAGTLGSAVHDDGVVGAEQAVVMIGDGRGVVIHAGFGAEHLTEAVEFHTHAAGVAVGVRRAADETHQAVGAADRGEIALQRDAREGQRVRARQ